MINFDLLKEKFYTAWRTDISLDQYKGDELDFLRARLTSRLTAYDTLFKDFSILMQDFEDLDDSTFFAAPVMAFFFEYIRCVTET